LTTRHATAAVACALGLAATSCASITGDATAPVAIEFVAPPAAVEEFDTVAIRVRVRDRAGDTIPNAAVQLVSLAPDTLGVPTGRVSVFGLRPGGSRMVAISGGLHSDPLPIQVVRAPDSLALVGSSLDSVSAAGSASDSLVVRLLDLRTDATQALGLAARPVSFAIVYPPFASAAAAREVLAGNDSLTAVVLTTAASPGGTAAVVVRRQGTPQPDSVVVQASAKRANGAAVRGSPVTFIVRFR
jgi:hypothetical protein